eukprot:1157437-Pelagomonas_calceolata.AAC.5
MTVMHKFHKSLYFGSSTHAFYLVVTGLTKHRCVSKIRVKHFQTQLMCKATSIKQLGSKDSVSAPAPWRIDNAWIEHWTAWNKGGVDSWTGSKWWQRHIGWIRDAIRFEGARST